MKGLVKPQTRRNFIIFLQYIKKEAVLRYICHILNEDTQLVMRAIEVSHTACKDEFRRNLRSHCWSVFSFFIIKIEIHSTCEILAPEKIDYIFVETFASCVLYSNRAYNWVCVLVNDKGRRLPLELQCTLYQGQQHIPKIIKI